LVRSYILCSCEDVEVDKVVQAVQKGAETFDDIKRLTKCGAGKCQAKVCMTLVTDILLKHTKRKRADILPPRFRMPLRPVSLSTLASKKMDESGLKTVLDEAAAYQEETK
jgi:bacterioferritin-associated ferredoxin